MSIAPQANSRAILELYQRAPLLELGRAGRRRALAAASRSRSSPTSSTATSTTPTSASPTAGSARSTAGPKHDEGYVLSFEQIGAQDRRVQGARRRADPAAGRAQPVHPVRVVPRPDALHQAAPSDPHPRLLARREVVFFSERFRHAGAPTSSASSRRPASTPSRAAAARSWSTRSAQRVAKKKAQTEEWLGVQEEAHRQGMKTSVTMMYGLGETRRGPDRAPLPRARAAGAHRRLHRVHLLAAAARGHAGDVAHARRPTR